MAGTTAPDDDLILDLRDLVKPRRRVNTTAGMFGLMGLEQLDALARTNVNEAMRAAQREAEKIVGMAPTDDDYLPCSQRMADAEDEVLAVAIPDSTREQRDKITPPERAALMAAFMGAADEAALAMAGRMREIAREHGVGTTGARSSRSSKRRTAATRTAG